MFTKNSIIIATVLLLGISLVGCNQDKVDQLDRQNQQLQADRARQDSLLNDFMATFNAFEENLAVIKEKEQLINLQTDGSEMRVEAKDQVVQDIQMINDLLDQNRQIIEDLTARAQSAEVKSGEYQRMITRLKQKLTDSDTEITGLKDQLSSMAFTVESLNGRLDTLSERSSMLARLTEEQSETLLSREDSLREQQEVLTQQANDLNTAYFVTGSTKELKDSEVLSNSKIVNKDLNPKLFTQIDIRETQVITLATKKPQLLTNHPTDSYVFLDDDQDKTFDRIEITNPEKFWRSSKYLVVVTN
jgi:chromosome segregation ATPase